MKDGIGVLILKIIATTIVTLFVSVVFLLFSYTNGMPFIEGDNKVISGKAYKFEIGMSKRDAFKAIQSHYNKNNYFIRTLWLKDSDINEELQSFQNTEWQEYANRKYSEYKILISELNEITPPLEHGGRWDIRMPAHWVNSIYLTFEDGRLIEIQKSRWLIERP